MSGNGWIKLHRKIKDNFLWGAETFTKAQAWIDILMEVNHSPGKTMIDNDVIEVDVGETITSLRQLSKRWDWSRTKVKNFLELLEAEDMIEFDSTKKMTRLKVLNYQQFQREKFKQNDTEMTRKNNGNDTEMTQKNTNKNVKNEKNKKNVKNKTSNGEEENSDTGQGADPEYINGIKVDRYQKDNGFYEYPPKFKAIWEVYPRRKNKKKAWLEWKDRLSEGVDHDLLMKAVERYAQECKLNDTEKRYIKYPQTFLGSGGYWQEYLEKEGGKSSAGTGGEKLSGNFAGKDGGESPGEWLQRKIEDEKKQGGNT